MSERNSIAEKNECTENYLKFIVVYLLCVTIALLMIKGILSMNIFDVNEKPTDVILAILASVTLFCTFSEYHNHRRREKADVLGQYNERYSRDEHINCVVDYMVRYMDNEKIVNKPSAHDAEMFMRFFEEMDIQIEEKRLDEKHVYTLFAYYAIKFCEIDDYRRSLGIRDFDKPYVWVHYKRFVERMKKLGNEYQKDITTNNKHFCFNYIDELYDNIIKRPEKWKYYDYNPTIRSFENLYKVGYSSPYYFILEYLDVSQKYLDETLFNCFSRLSEKENCEDKELKGRIRHIVSLFFWGHVLYQSIPIIKENMNEQFKNFIEFGLFKEEKVSDETLQQLFSFIWFLLCMFHDFGYAYEKKLIPMKETMLPTEKPACFVPEIFSNENVKKYDKYRKCVFGCHDHGIYGGRVFYNGMLKIGKKLAEDPNKGNIFKTVNVETIYQYAAWVISCHNIFYNNGNDDYTDCYKCMGLDDFIKPKARCVTLKNNPLLFLFCLADSIEPTKTLVSTDGNSDYELCRGLKIGFNKEENLMNFDLSGITCKKVVERYEKNIKSLNDWLIDVSDDLTLNFG